jgi:hypothetical protein
MGRVASSVDHTVIESFWSTMQRELLNTRRWTIAFVRRRSRASDRSTFERTPVTRHANIRNAADR